MIRPPCVYVVPRNTHLSVGSHKILILLDAHKSLANRENELVVIPLSFFSSISSEFSSECDALP